MRDWLPRGRALVAVLLLAVVAAAVIVGLTRGGKDKKQDCVAVTVNAAPTSDTPEQALSLFVANQQDAGPLPIDLGSWTVSSQSGTQTVFTSNRHGQWTVTVGDGGVQSYSGCSG